MAINVSIMHYDRLSCAVLLTVATHAHNTAVDSRWSTILTLASLSLTLSVLSNATLSIDDVLVRGSSFILQCELLLLYHINIVVIIIIIIISSSSSTSSSNGSSSSNIRVSIILSTHLAIR